MVSEGVNDPGIFKAIFLAGGPGSGKSFVASNLFGIPEKINVSPYGLKIVNQDAEFELLLNSEDPDIYKWIVKFEAPNDKSLNDIIIKIREYLKVNQINVLS